MIIGVPSVLTVPSLGLVMLGAIGAVASITNVTAADSSLVLPAASVAFAVMPCARAHDALLGVNDQPPPPSAIVVHWEPPSLTTSTVLIPSAVPLIDGVA